VANHYDAHFKLNLDTAQKGALVEFLKGF